MIALIIIICITYTEAFLATSPSIVTGNITFVCAFFRPKDLSIDDIRMPEILTFCSCVVIHQSWVLTSRQCYVQPEWFVSPVTDKFTSKLPQNVHKIEDIYDRHEMSLVKVTPDINTGIVELTTNILNESMICKLYGFAPVNNEAIKGDDDSLIYKIWKMESDLLETKVKVLNYNECGEKFKFLSWNKWNIVDTTLCVNPVNNEYLEPCSFDRGAPIICNGVLQGVLVYNRPVPRKVPIYLPSGCYGSINNDISIYAEGLTEKYLEWIHAVLFET